MAKRILIIGGGVSGCYLAALLGECGSNVTLVERAAHLGGRAAVLRDLHTGDLLELGPHLLMRCYSSFYRFAEKIGATGRLQFQASLKMPFRLSSDRTSHFACPQFPAPLHVAAALLRFSRLSVWDRLSGFRIGPELLRRKWFGADPLDSETAWAWLRRCGQTPEICRTLWEPLCEAALNLPLEKGSAKLMANVLVEAFCRSRKDSSLGWVAGGTGNMCDTDARRFIESHGGMVLTRVNVDHLLLSNERVTGAVLSTGQRMEADLVISTMAPWDLRALLTRSDLGKSARVENMARFVPSPILTLNLWPDCEITDEHFVHLEGKRFQWLFDNQKHVGTTPSVSPPSTGSGQRPNLGEIPVRCYSLLISGPSDLNECSKEELVRFALEDVGDLFPGAKIAKVLHSSVSKQRRATYSPYPNMEPFRPEPGQWLKGLYLAGDWTATGLPCTLESACRSVEVLANQITL
ncbi:MAG TPA: hydroxysqualene dehydroxylase HpnE [bacterium]|nr:hydroxysqualene dehydroxylase HpnE [bacterium]